MNRPDISACICTCDRYLLLEKAFESIVEQMMPRERFEIIVVDTTPDDRRQVALERRLRGRGVRWLRAAEAGLAEARNSALHDCRAPVIAYLDDDAVAEPDWLEMLVAGFERIEDLGALGGRVDPIWEVPAPAWLPRSMYGYLSVVDWGDEVIDIGEAQWLAGTNIALRVAPVRRIGGFRCHLGRRPGVLLGNEETELCQRLTQAGLRVVYDPAIEVRHLVSRERCSQAWIRRRVAWQAISNLMTEPQRTATTEWYRSCIEAYRGASADSGGEPETLTRDVPTAEMFEAQCRAVFAWTMLLAGVSNDLRKCA